MNAFERSTNYRVVDSKEITRSSRLHIREGWGKDGNYLHRGPLLTKRCDHLTTNLVMSRNHEKLLKYPCSSVMTSDSDEVHLRRMGDIKSFEQF